VIKEEVDGEKRGGKEKEVKRPEVELKDISRRLKPDFNAVRLSEKKKF